jgi:hypothetical protein
MNWYERLIAKTATKLTEWRTRDQARLKANGIDEAVLGARFFWNIILWMVIGFPAVFILDRPPISLIVLTGFLVWLVLIMYRFSVVPYRTRGV